MKPNDILWCVDEGINGNFVVPPKLGYIYICRSVLGERLITINFDKHCWRKSRFINLNDIFDEETIADIRRHYETR
jgi:hypothetical protein